MATPTLLVTHGRDQRWEIELTLARAWEEALRSGLKRVGAPYWDSIPVRFAYYAGPWRDDAERSEDISPIQAEFAAELLDRSGQAGADAEDRSIWSGLNRLVEFVDKHVGIGGEVVLEVFLKDLAQYFRDETRRAEANGVLTAEVGKAAGDVILLGHSMGSIVSYLSLHEQRSALEQVRGLVTFGSPLGMQAIRKRVEAIVPGLPFPPSPRRWLNIYNDEDFATTVPLLAPIFRSTDGREIDDQEAVGRSPSLSSPGRGHDALIYLSSRGLATRLRGLIDELGGGQSASMRAGPPARDREEPEGRPRMAAPPPPAPADAFGSERIAPPWLGDDVDERIAPPWLGDDRSGGDERATRSYELDGATTAVASPPATRRERAPAAAPSVVNRTLSADFPPVVAPQTEHDLLIAIAAAAVYAGGQATFAIERPVGVSTVDLRIGVYAPDFVVTASTGAVTSVAEVTLNLDDASERLDARFRLRAPKAKEAVSASIWVTVWRGTLPVGQLELRTRIDPAYVAPAQKIKLSFSGAADPDVTVVVADRSENEVGTGPFELRVSREGVYFDRELGPLKFAPQTDAWQAARDLLEKYRLVNQLNSKEERIKRATAIGVELWWLLPDAFRAFYWDELHHSETRSIAIYSAEPYIPWELVVPQRQRGGRTEPMLGLAYSMARWKQGRHFPDPLVVSGISVIAPEYTVGSLPEAALEAGELVERFGAKRVQGNRAAVTRLMRSRGTQLIHFAGHGSYDPANVDDSEIRLSDGPFVPSDLFDASIGTRERPFVFLNACQVGEQGWDLTQIGGWAEAFCAAGFSGFVGPYWKVNDKVAHKAARVFYEALGASSTVGEAMQAVRRRFLEDDQYPTHTSWLAYSLHCQPNVHIKLPTTNT